VATRSATFDESFAHDWQAVILERPLLVFHGQQYIYPQAVRKLDAVEVGEVGLDALQILLCARPEATTDMATFALGFAESSLPHGVWSCPNPKQLCAVAGGYAYLVQPGQPSQCTQIPYRPVVSIHPAVEQNLLIFASFHKLWALGPNGQVWETARLSWEGLRVTGIAGQKLEGFGWDMMADSEVAFTVDLTTGNHIGGAGPNNSVSEGR
jgi:hypothetical protein